MAGKKRKRSRGFYFTRGLRTHRYYCVALRGFFLEEKRKRKRRKGFYFTRGLRTHRYHCVALWAFKKSQPSQPFLILHSLFIIHCSPFTFTFFIFHSSFPAHRQSTIVYTASIQHIYPGQF